MLYKGNFNFQGEEHEVFCHATSESQAFRFLTIQVSNKLNGRKTPSDLRLYFEKKAGSYTINVVPEKKGEEGAYFTFDRARY